jgi:hypothetical protein
MENTNCQNRQSRRSQVLLSATIECGGSEKPVKLRNLSEQGALVEGTKLPIEGSQVVFKRKELEASGRVVWVNGKLAGIAFADRLETEQVLRHIPAPRHIQQPKSWRPGFTTVKLTDEQRHLAESWIWSPPHVRLGE